MTDKELRDISEKLPPAFEIVNREMELLGSDIIARKMMMDKIIIPGKKYKLMGEAKVPVNHYKALKRIYKKEGRQGVNAYIVKVMPEIGEYFKKKAEL